MKFYVITAGEYSDYSIYGVAIDHEVAERIKKCVAKGIYEPEDDVRIEEYDTDVWQEIVKVGQLFNVVFYSNGEIRAFSFLSNVTEDFAKRNKIMKRRRAAGYEVLVLARDEEHAIKIATDLFAEYKYRKEVDGNAEAV